MVAREKFYHEVNLLARNDRLALRSLNLKREKFLFTRCLGMHVNSVSAVTAAMEKERDGRAQRAKAVDLRVRDLVVSLPRVKESSLLATVVDPTRHMVPNGETNHQVEWGGGKKKKEPRHVHGSSFHFPIGIKRSDSYPWINALMQFLLFLPTCREILSYLPKSLQGIKEFSDRYFFDVETKRNLSLADGTLAAAGLLNKFPTLFCEEGGIANLDEAVQLLWTSASLRVKRPAWQLLWDSSQRVEELFSQEAVSTAFEWLIGLKELYEPGRPLFQGHCLQRHYLLKQASSYMEMDAFIEARPDEGKRIGYYAYLKVGGTWVQCADERISRLKCSRSLEMPLQRGVLFHFKRVPMR